MGVGGWVYSLAYVFARKASNGVEKTAETSFGSRRGMRSDSRSTGMSTLFKLSRMASLGELGVSLFACVGRRTATTGRTERLFRER